MTKWISLISGGIAGTAARYLLSGLLNGWMGTNFPYGTLMVNLIGCFLIGFFASLAEGKFFLGPNARLLLMVGFCGAFTTFSTFMLETAGLMKDGEMLRAFFNVMISVIAGFFIFRLGVLVAEYV
ncbi:MAG: fluoride efflux transporter CrcB [Candidatus Omnitrophica bacterium]|nr:fluoride efflux transporter CrcB [Candidatus Omnitrophota bacterium]